MVGETGADEKRGGRARGARVSPVSDFGLRIGALHPEASVCAAVGDRETVVPMVKQRER